jgi:hypothetical protein
MFSAFINMWQKYTKAISPEKNSQMNKKMESKSELDYADLKRYADLLWASLIFQIFIRCTELSIITKLSCEALNPCLRAGAAIGRFSFPVNVRSVCIIVLVYNEAFI